MVTLLTLGMVGTIPADAASDVVNVTPPQVTGTPMFDRVLRAGPGVWDPADVDVAYRWLRDGAPIPGARERSYRLRLGDLGHRMSVRVTATATDGSSAQAVSAQTAKVVRAPLGNRRLPEVVGVQRFTRMVTATPGRWSASVSRVRYQWLRAGRPIRGATTAHYRFVPQDVGRSVRVRVTVHSPGHTSRTGHVGSHPSGAAPRRRTPNRSLQRAHPRHARRERGGVPPARAADL